jgi:exonuclease SbcD
MRFFHLSDLHIGLKLMNHDLSEDQRHVFKEIAEYAGERQPDAIVIAGDIYDKAVPSAEAVELFDEFVMMLTEAAPKAELMMISGNHDSGSRVNVFRGILSRHHIHMIGLPPRSDDERIEKVTLKDENGPVNFYLLPFVKPSMVRGIVAKEGEAGLSYEESLRRLFARENINTDERNVLVSHQFFLPSGEDAQNIERMESEICTVGNVDAVSAELLKPFDYAVLGHIHKPMKVGSEIIRYCGTPLACSVSEAGQEKGVIEVTLEAKGEIKTEVLPLKPLREVRVLKGTLEEILEHPSDDYVTVILTDVNGNDSFDMQDRLHFAFPHLLEIRREENRATDYQVELTGLKHLDAYELCTEFLSDLNEEEKDILRDVINTVREVR